MKRLVMVALLAACGGARAPGRAPSSSTIAITSDDKTLWVVNQDADSISAIDVATRTLVAEIPLGAAPPAVDGSGRFEPQVKPRALALLPGDKKIYVAGQTANAVLVIDAVAKKLLTSIPVGAEPVGIVAAPDGKAVYVASSMAAEVAKIDPAKDAVIATLPLGTPGDMQLWGASMSADGARLYVAQFLLHPGVATINAKTFTVAHQLELAVQPPDTANGKLVPNGVVRGVYAAVPRPTSGEVWMTHLLLAIGTAEPDLDFQSTVFPTLSTATPDGSAEGNRLLFSPLAVAGAGGAFNDVVSGPHAIDFTPDGKLALVVNSQSEDVLVFDGAAQVEVGLVRPLASTFPEGVVVDHAGKHAYVEGRASLDVTPLAIDAGDAAAPVRADGPAIARVMHDPMPAELRLGQRLFYSADSAQYAVTQNFWVACSTCHLEGRTDAVTWRFLVGPRDTPSNAGGPINTGFLLRQALRTKVAHYDKTINLEQGGTFDRANPSQQPLLDALSAFVNFAIPFPQNPYRSPDGTMTPSQQHGHMLFMANCTSCHSGPFHTDSGAGNPTLDLAGKIVLHDIGTCVRSGPFVDQAAPDEGDGATHLMHTACDFDTPTLRSIFASAPYFHDGSAATLLDVVNRVPASAALGDADKADLVAFLQTL